MIVTTTPMIDGHKCNEYLGIIHGETILGTTFVRDCMASFTDFFGGRSKAYEDEFQKVRKIAISELEARSSAIGAKTVVGISIDYEVLDPTNGILMVTVAITAVLID
ncbi:MAG: heavy metal-binding domain-containing protein [Firmicutes bacterium]|nr:heavy metal-binding domain-containing protein [Bacillota bacterium]MDD4263452.1 heavy metal-binding domain-containing protein [Bacillota bacterium]MDD4694365.1 heavy metal-binding domain-containing protein [Bacillota bacterium]